MEHQIKFNTVKKGIVEEIFSKAKFGDGIDSYFVSYRDFEKIMEVSMPRFIEESEDFQKIPMSRITKIRKNNTVLFEKTSPKDD